MKFPSVIIQVKEYYNASHCNMYPSNQHMQSYSIFRQFDGKYLGLMYLEDIWKHFPDEWNPAGVRPYVYTFLTDEKIAEQVQNERV